MLKNAAVAILAVFILLGAFATPILDGIKGWRSDDVTQSYIVTTGAGVTTQNVTLTRELYNSDVSEVIAVTSNITETPVSTSYDEDTQNLLISALAAADSRTLTVEYYGEDENVVMKALGPFLPVLIIGGLLIATVAGIWLSKKGKR